MKMKSISVLLFSLILTIGCGQSIRQVRTIEFSTSSRGYSKQVAFKKNRLTIFEESHVGSVEPKSISYPLKKLEWNKLIECLNHVSIAGLPDLKSPSMDRAFDGARTSTITIIIHNGKSWSHNFDNENPHEKLQPLMKAILELTSR
jgi:hypothetical protein